MKKKTRREKSGKAIEPMNRDQLFSSTFERQARSFLTSNSLLFSLTHES